MKEIGREAIRKPSLACKIAFDPETFVAPPVSNAVVEPLTEYHGMVQKLISTGIFIGAAASVAYPLLKQRWVGPAPFDTLPGIAALAGIASFLLAAIAIWFNSRLGHCLGSLRAPPSYPGSF